MLENKFINDNFTSISNELRTLGSRLPKRGQYRLSSCNRIAVRHGQYYVSRLISNCVSICWGIYTMQQIDPLSKLSFGLQNRLLTLLVLFRCYLGGISASCLVFSITKWTLEGLVKVCHHTVDTNNTGEIPSYKIYFQDLLFKCMSHGSCFTINKL
jgi:hypothetical protein